MKKLAFLCILLAIACAALAFKLITITPHEENRRNLPKSDVYLERFAPMRDVPSQYLCIKTDAKPVIDGTLEKEFWEKIKPTENFWIAGDSRKRGPRKTEVKMAWDDQNLYVAWIADDRNIIAEVTEPDGDVWWDDVVEIFISPWNDRYHYYEIDINVLGTVFDAEVRNHLEQGWYEALEVDKTFTAEGMQCAIAIDGTLNEPKKGDNRYIVEIAIPFASFARTRECPPMDGANWRLNFFRGDMKARQEPDGMYEWSRNYWTQAAFHIPRGFGHLLFVE
jgi:hypothetical protein